jgi:hypothetical protein
MRSSSRENGLMRPASAQFPELADTYRMKSNFPNPANRATRHPLHAGEKRVFAQPRYAPRALGGMTASNDL